MTVEDVPRAGAWLRPVGWLLLLVTGLAVVIVVSIFHSLHTSRTPPDVAKVARSSAVADADNVAVTRLDQRMAEVRAAAPWLTPGAMGIDDTCGSEPGSFVGEGWSPVSCVRTVDQVLACDCDLAARIAKWGTALAGSGWIGRDAMATPAPLGSRELTGPDAVRLRIDWGGSTSHLFRPAESRPAPHAGPSLDVDAAVSEAKNRYRQVAVVTASLRYYGDEGR